MELSASEIEKNDMKNCNGFISKFYLLFIMREWQSFVDKNLLNGMTSHPRLNIIYDVFVTRPR